MNIFISRTDYDSLYKKKEKIKNMINCKKLKDLKKNRNMPNKNNEIMKK